MGFLTGWQQLGPQQQATQPPEFFWNGPKVQKPDWVGPETQQTSFMGPTTRSALWMGPETQKPQWIGSGPAIAGQEDSEPFNYVTPTIHGPQSMNSYYQIPTAPVPQSMPGLRSWMDNLMRARGLMK